MAEAPRYLNGEKEGGAGNIASCYEKETFHADDKGAILWYGYMGSFCWQNETFGSMKRF